MFQKVALSGCIAVLLTGFLAVTPAKAVTITATELIQDLLPLDAFHRDLQRVRSSTTTATVIENSDAAITSPAQNNVDNDFGLINLDNVSYRHDLTWLTPSPSSFLFASLSISAFGVFGSNDMVFVDNIQLGPLNDGLFTTTVFSSSNPIELAVLFADGYLNVFIDKNENNNNRHSLFDCLDCLNAISVYSSELTVRYESVPEPASVLLFGSGLAAIGLKRRKRGQPS